MTTARAREFWICWSSPVCHPGLVSMALFSAGSCHICYLAASVSNVKLAYLPGTHPPAVSPRVGSGQCRISPFRFLAECCKRQLNQVSFVLLYFRLSTFSDLYWVCLSVFSLLFCLSVSVKWLAVKTASEMTYTVSSGALNYSNSSGVPQGSVMYTTPLSTLISSCSLNHITSMQMTPALSILSSDSLRLQRRSPSECSKSNFLLDDCKSFCTELL